MEEEKGDYGGGKIDDGGDGREDEAGDQSLPTQLSCLSWDLAQDPPQHSAFVVPTASMLPSPLVSSGILYVNKSLDFETSPKHFLSVECSRKASSSLSDMTTIVVNITDVNEHRPRFPQHLYSTRVLENAIVGDVVLTVRICDFALCVCVGGGGMASGVGSCLPFL